MDKEYYSQLYEIASHLNKEFSLPAVLRRSLEKMVQLLDLETGWIWMVEKDVRSVYLAASYNLPPALRDHPERLSGWCYCIEKYFSGSIEEGTNVSEITCSRLKDISSGTRDLRFHATIPIITNGQKVGLLNLLSKEKQQLNEKQLAILNTISELIGIAVQRTRLQEVYVKEAPFTNRTIHEMLKRVFEKRIDQVHSDLTNAVSQLKGMDPQKALPKVMEALNKMDELKAQLALVLNETLEKKAHQAQEKEFHFPTSPLTPREHEVLVLVKKGLTNGQIAEQLYISERTVKFHLTSILSKLYAETRTQAVDIALQRGLISP